LDHPELCALFSAKLIGVKMKKSAEGLIFLDNPKLIEFCDLRDIDFLVVDADFLEQVNSDSLAGKRVFQISRDLPEGIGADFKKFFFEAMGNEPTNIMLGFCNPIFESAVTPLANIYSTIEEVVNIYGTNFSLKITGYDSGFGSTYFMAEGERSSQFLYSRMLWWGAYLKVFCRTFGIKTVVLCTVCKKKGLIESKSRRRYVIFRRLLAFFRREAVFVYKLLLRAKIGFWDFLAKKPKFSEEKIKPAEYLFVSRSKSQTEFFLEFSSTFGDAKILCTESYSFYGDNLKYVAGHVDKNSHIEYRIPQGFIFYCIIHVKAFLDRSKHQRRIFFSYGNFFVDLTDAVKEASVLGADLTLYAKLLKSALDENDSELKCLVTAEHKTQYGYTECLLAKSMGLKAVQFYEPDHQVTVLPDYLFGDAAFVNSTFSQEKFTRYYNDSRFHYVGSPRGKKRLGKSETRDLIVFFTKPNEQRNSLLIAEAISEAFLGRFKLAIKLHPRDGETYSGLEGRFLIYSHAEIRNTELIARTRLAVLYNSTVGQQLLDDSVPYIVCRFNSGEEYELPYANSSFRNVARNVGELSGFFTDLEYVDENSRSFRKQYELFEDSSLYQVRDRFREIIENV
jgi:hypothetical protein